MPSRNQTRRSISVTGRTYERVRTMAAATEESVSGLIERLIAVEGDRVGVPQPDKPGLRPNRQRDPGLDDWDQFRSF